MSRTGPSRLEHALRPWRRANRMARWLVVVGAVITLAFAVLAVFADQIAPYGQDQYRYELAGAPAGDDGEPALESIPRREAPQAGFPFGTTSARFDVFSRIVHGARVAFGVVVLSTIVAMGIGVPLGLVSGYRGGRVDRLLVLIMDAVYVFPPLLLAIIAAFVLKEYLDPGLPSAAVAVGAVYIPQYFRVIRNHTLSVKQEPFVEAARSLGAPPRTILGRYVFFNVVQSVPVIFTLNAADAVLTLAGLGFLGYGVPYPQAEWGLDVSRAISDVVSGFWWTAFFPGLAITLLVTGLTLVGEGLNDIVNPLLRVRGYTGKVPARKEPTAEATRGSDDEEITDLAKTGVV
ncbi:MAG: ABC transporter permease [Actinomycetota bacterium]|nr:ABC transporter permease [Actinomycetota bacterium]